MEEEKALSAKVKQVIQLTSCSEELAALTLHEFSYEVATTVDFLLDNDVVNLENVIETKQRPSRRSVPPTSQPNEGIENCTNLEATESQMPTARRKTREGISEEKGEHDRTLFSGDSRRSGTGRRGRNRMRRPRGDVVRQENVGLGENFNKENEDVPENAERVNETSPRNMDRHNQKFIPRRRGPRRGANHSEPFGLSEEPSFGIRPSRYQGYRGGMRMRGGGQRGGFRNLREDGGRVFSRREPAGESMHFRGREEEYRQEADGWDASEGYGLTNTHDNVEEVPSWSGEPLVLTNSKAAAQSVDQLMDANDASIQSILSQYSARVTVGEPGQIQPTSTEIHDSAAREHLSISGLASGEDEKVDWATWGTSPTPATTNLYNSVKTTSSSNTLQSATQALKEMIGVNGSLMTSNHLHSSQVQSQQVSKQMNPEDPEVLRRGIFQRPQRSKPPPQPQKAPERPNDLPSQIRPEPLGSYSSGFRFGDDDLEENYLSKVIAPVFSKSAMPPSSTIHSSHAANLGSKDVPNSNAHLLTNVSSTPSELSTQPSQQRTQNYTQEATMHIRQQLGLMTTPPSNSSDPGNVRSPSQLSSSNEKQNHELHPTVQHSVPQLQQSQVASTNNTTSAHKNINSSASGSNVPVSSQDSGPSSNILTTYHVMDSYDRSTNQSVNNMATNSPPNMQQPSAMQVNPQRMMPTPLMSSSYMPSTTSYNQSLSQFPQPMQPTVTGAMPQLDLSNPSTLLQALSSCLNHPQFQHMHGPILQALIQQSQFYSASGGNPSPPMNAGPSGIMASGSHPPGLIPPHTATAGGYASVSLPGNIPPHQAMPPPNMMNMFAPQVTLSTGSTAPTASADAALGQRNPYYSGMAAQHYFTQQQQQHHLLLSAAAQSNSNASMGVSSGEQQPQTQMDESNNPPSMAEQQRNAMSSGSNAVDKYPNLKHMYPSPMKQQQAMGGVNNPQSQGTQNSGGSLFASSTSGAVGMDFHHTGHHTTPQGGIYIPQNAAGNNTSAAYHHPGMTASFVAASYNPQQAPQGSGNPHYLTQAVLMQPTGSVGGPKIPAMPHNTKNSVTNYGAWMNAAPNPGASASGNN